MNQLGLCLVLGLAALWQASAQDLCVPNICLNGGVCLIVLGKPSCACPDGFSGKLCDVGAPSAPATTAAPSSACDAKPCLNGGTCVTSSVGSVTFPCLCADGWLGSVCQSQDGAVTAAPTTPAPDTCNVA